MNYTPKDLQEATGIIYKISNSKNDRVYIGQTIQSLSRRWRAHKLDSKTRDTKASIHQAMYDLGIENFDIEIIERVPVYKLDERESYWINQYNSYRDGYNLTKGGREFALCFRFSEDMMKQIINDYEKGVIVDDLQRMYSISITELYLILEMYQTPKRGRNSDRCSESSRQNFLKASESNKKPIKNITLGITYPSIKEAILDMMNKGYSKAKDWKTSRSPLYRVLNNKQKTYLNFEWEYIDG